MMKSYKQRMNERNRVDPRTRLLADDELTRLQRTLLAMYLDVQETCEHNGITCILLGGSALGAVRHGGFIPWDDDLDLGMTRSDFNRFLNIFEHELGDRYALDGPNCGMQAGNRFTKVLKKGTRFVEVGMIEDERSCIKLDIFVLENVPNDILRRLFKGLKCTVLMAIASCVEGHEIRRFLGTRELSPRAFVGALFSSKPSHSWFDIVDRAVRWHDETSTCMGIPTGRKHYFGEILPREVYLPPSTAFFEGHSVSLPRDVDRYLANLYGDYMRIPPEHNRERHYVRNISF